MKCDEMEILISAYVDGETDDEETRRVEYHLGECSHCQTVLVEFRDMQVLSHDMPKLEAPKGFRQRVTQCIDDEPKRIFVWKLPRLAYVLSCVLCVLMIGMGVWYVRGPALETPVEVAEADIQFYAEDVLFGDSFFQETNMFSESEEKSTEDMLEAFFGSTDTSLGVSGKSSSRNIG